MECGLWPTGGAGGRAGACLHSPRTHTDSHTPLTYARAQELTYHTQRHTDTLAYHTYTPTPTVTRHTDVWTHSTHHTPVHKDTHSQGSGDTCERLATGTQECGSMKGLGQKGKATGRECKGREPQATHWTQQVWGKRCTQMSTVRAGLAGFWNFAHTHQLRQASQPHGKVRQTELRCTQRVPPPWGTRPATSPCSGSP